MIQSKHFGSILRLRSHLSNIQTRVPAFTRFPSITRAMASDAPKESNNKDNTPNTQASTSSQQPSQPLPLPEPPANADNTTQINVNGEGVKLDHLGPLVVNKDGTLSRIANWDKMAEIEKQNTLRILGKRNQLRRENLKAAGEGKAGE